MEYTALESIQHYADCAPLCDGLGYSLIELKIGHTKNTYQVRAVIMQKSGLGIGIDDCSKVHRLLLARLEALFQSQEVYMEVTSPGTERNIKNAAEFAFFVHKPVRLWVTEEKDWVCGIIFSADSQSVTLKINETERCIPFEHITKAKLA